MKSRTDEEEERKLALKLLRVLKIPYNEEFGFGPAWDGFTLHSKMIVPEHLAHEAGHWLVAGPYRTSQNYGLGPDLDYQNRVRPVIPREQHDEYEMQASYAGVFMGVRMGMDLLGLLAGVNLASDEIGDHMRYFKTLQNKDLLPYQLENFRRVKTKRRIDIPSWVSVAVWG